MLAQLDNKQRLDNLVAAVDFLKGMRTSRPFESVDVAVHLDLDTKRTDQRVRGTVTLPHGTGKVWARPPVVCAAAAEVITLCARPSSSPHSSAVWQTLVVAVFTKDPTQARAARDAGADMVGLEDMVEEIKGGVVNFDRAVATADAMPSLAQVARVLGPRGLMPTPKRGTVVTDVDAAVRELKAGKVEFRASREGLVHAAIGRADFSSENLARNLAAMLDAVLAARPVAFRRKAPFVRGTGRVGLRPARSLSTHSPSDHLPCTALQSIALSTTMGRGSVAIDPRTEVATVREPRRRRRRRLRGAADADGEPLTREPGEEAEGAGMPDAGPEKGFD